MKRSPLAWLLSAAVLLLGLNTTAFAQRVIRIVVPFGPGAVQDTVARTFNTELGQLLGATVVIENRAGAGGTVGTAAVAKAAPDGNTLVMAAASHTLAGHMYAKLAYDPIKDFAPVSMLGYSGYVIAAPSSMGVNNLADYIRLVKSKSKQLNYASAGNGNATHLAGELFNMMARVKTVHVPYKGGGHARTELLGGQVDFMFHNITAVLGDVKVGRLRALAVTGLTRTQAAPDIPTLDESALRGYEITSWFGAVAPVGVPQAVVTRLQGEFSKVMQIVDVREKLAVLGSEAVGGGSADFAKHLRTEQDKWGRLIQQAGIRLE